MDSIQVNVNKIFNVDFQAYLTEKIAATCSVILYIIIEMSTVRIYTTLPLWPGCDTSSIFKWSTTSLNSKFSFS